MLHSAEPISANKIVESQVNLLPTISPLPVASPSTPAVNTNSATNGAFATAIASLASTPQKELAACGTYKVRIQRRCSSALLDSITASPLKSMGVMSSSHSKHLSSIDTTTMTNAVVTTPSKSTQQLFLSTAQLSNNSTITTSTMTSTITSNASSICSTSASQNNFECPECDKKFVSYYGLVQHYDQHPTLAVTCACCDITFDDHHALVVHNAVVHLLSESSGFGNSGGGSGNSKER